MEYLKSLHNIHAAMGLFVPGLIVLFIRSQFVTDRRPSHSAAVLTYLAVSLVYYALLFPFFDLVRLLSEPRYDGVWVWFLLIFAGPAILGALLGINIQKNLLRRFLRLLGINIVHAIPTAWDWKFGNMTEQWVLVTLKDDTRFAGFCGPGSFMSSDPAERDIYIERIYDIDDEDRWLPRGENSALIAPGEIKTIEFWPKSQGENADEQD